MLSKEQTQLPRLFIAIPISDHLREHIQHEAKALREKHSFQKWTDPADYHITLKFLGETSAAKADEIKKAMERIASCTEMFTLSETGWGTFGSPSAPSILWAGIGGDLGPLHKLQLKVDEQLNALGFEKETRSYHPHLTIARRYTGKKEPDALSLRQCLPQSEENAVEWKANEVDLYQSHPKKTPMYEAIASVHLGIS
jgi:2'-5' RNA ligase